MIYGIGTDICDIRRIAATLARRGDRFAERVLGPLELAGVPRPPRQARGARRALPGDALLRQGGVLQGDRPRAAHADDLARLRDRQRCRAASPRSACNGVLADWFEARGLRAHVSVTDEADYAASFVVVETRSER